MAEVLSQSQIDALLSAARSGQKLPAEENRHGKEHWRRYDFTSPRKFTKDRLKMLSGIFENYTRIINSRLNGLLHATCEITVGSVEEQRYYEFANGLSEDDVLALAGIAVEGQPQVEDMPVLLHVSTPLMLSMMDRLLGGDGDTAGFGGSGFTNLELRLYESMARELIGGLGSSWEACIPLEFQYKRVETNPTLMQMMGPDETVVIVGMDLRFSNSSGRMSVCLPGLVLSNVFARIDDAGKGSVGSGEDNSEEILALLRDSGLELVAELGRVTVRLEDLYTLSPGDVIDLGHGVDEPIRLCVGGEPWFRGVMGTQKNSMAVKIVDAPERQEGEEAP